MLIITTSPSTSAASTDGLRERIVASVMAEVGSVLDTVGIAVARLGRRQIYCGRRALSRRMRVGAAGCAAGRRIKTRRRDAALLACAAGCYGLPRFRPRRWMGM